MDKYSKLAKQVRKHLEDLEMMEETLIHLENDMRMIEMDLEEIEGNIPEDKTIDAMPEGSEKKRLKAIVQMLNESYDIIDRTIGPAPETEESLPYTPEARGNSVNESSLEEILREVMDGLGKDNEYAS